MAKTKQQLTREEIAQREIGHTQVRPGTAWMLAGLFLATIFAVSLTQTVHEIREHVTGNRTSAWPGCFDIFASLPRAVGAFDDSNGATFTRLMAANRSLQRDIDEFEATLRIDSLLTKKLLPPVQEFTARSIGLGNEKAYIGREGWLFYRPGIDYLTCRGFLDPRRLAKRADSGSEWHPAPQGDPRKAIFQFHRQLAQRGITLIVVGVPVKAQIHPEKFSNACNEHPKPLTNPSYDEFCRQLRNRGVLVFDPTAIIVGDRPKMNGFVPRYLRTDTHWRPEAMEATAGALAEFVRKNVDLPRVQPPAYNRITQSVSNLGDITRMLRLPKTQTLYPPETVEIHPVLTAGGEIWRPIRSADVLLLGDSFSNIYSLDAMGWGAGAGFAEQIGFALKRPLDAIVRNDAGAYATRQALSMELARGVDRLAKKRLVIWQFTERELSVGDWKLLDMTVGQWRPSEFVVPKAGEKMLVTAVIADASGVPRPRSVPYKDHIRSLHLIDLRDEAGQPMPNAQAVVYVWSMRDNVWTSGARLRPGQEVKLHLRPWSDVESELDGINRSELDDSTLAFETPCWAMLAKTTRKPAQSWVPQRPAIRETGAKKPTSQPAAGDLNKAFVADCAAKVAAAAKVDSKAASTVIKGKDGFLFFVPEVRHLSVGKFWGSEAAKVSRAAKSEWADPLPVILDFRDQLDKIGVELLLVPVPPKCVVYADKLSDTAPMDKTNLLPMRVETHLRAFYKVLAARGVKVLDLTPHFIAARKDDAAKGPVYCKSDTHFSPRGAQIAAALIAGHVKAQPWYEQVDQPTAPLLAKERKINIYGDLTRMLGRETSIKEILPARFIQPRASKAAEPMNTDRKSRILLLGDSHCLVFHTGGEMHARGAGLVDQIAFDLMAPIDLLGVKGSGVTASRINLLRRARADANYLKNKKLIIWCFTARDFTESRGWRKVPVVK